MGDREANEDIGAQARFGSVLDHLTEGFQVIGRDWRYLYINEAAAAHGRRSKAELLGRSMHEVYPGIEQTEMFALLERCMRERTMGRMENPFTYDDGSSAWFELRVEPIPEGLLVLSLDVTERKRIEEQLLQAQKMEAVGRLAGGVAHDFNNLLTVISSFTTLVRDDLKSLDPAREDLGEVLGAAERAAKLVRQLLAFSRQQPVEPRVLDLNQLVSGVDKMLRRVLGEDISYSTELEADLWPVRIDAGAFEQVLVNLAVNARDAMSDGGRLTIETGRVVLDDSYRMAKGGLVAPGEYVVTAVTDTGVGMDEATQLQIFEPFFTTKGPEQGTGLGLSTCYGIVQQAGGHIWVYSEPDHGTTFKIYLPRVRAELEDAAAAEESLPLGGTETILVAEDDAQVRKLAVRALERYGYTVLEAANAGEALLLCEDGSRPIDLLITDVVMPRMSGAKLAERLAKVCPDLRVLYMSGYTEKAMLHNRVLGHGARLLQKPFTPEVLGRKVRQVLEG